MKTNADSSFHPRFILHSSLILCVIIANSPRNAYPDEKIVFMGDRTLPGGNDYELAMALTLLADTETIQVSGPEAVINQITK